MPIIENRQLQGAAYDEQLINRSFIVPSSSDSTRDDGLRTHQLLRSVWAKTTLIARAIELIGIVYI